MMTPEEQMLVISEVSIRPANSPLGDTGAWVILKDEAGVLQPEGYMFTWFKHKIHFDESELIGLTVLEAHKLRHAKHQTVSEVKP